MSPILLRLGPIDIYSFGVFLALALFGGTFYAWREARNEFNDEAILDTIVALLVFAFLGGRLFYVFSHFGTFQLNLLRWIHFYLYPGFSFWGSIIGGVLGTLWFTQRKKISFWRLADFLVLGAGLGQILAQIGCFSNGCTVGKLTNLPWGMTVAGFIGKRHPVALYDALASLVIFLLVLRFYRWIFAQKRQREGSAALAFLFFLALFSFPLEFLKEGGLYFYGLDLNQWIAAVFFLVASWLFYWRLRNLKQDFFSTLAFFKQKIFLSKKQGGEGD